MKFQVGERVKHEMFGSGEIKFIAKAKDDEKYPYAVEFNKFMNGHNCDGHCKEGYGYWSREQSLIKEEPMTIRERIDAWYEKAKKAGVLWDKELEEIIQNILSKIPNRSYFLSFDIGYYDSNLNVGDIRIRCIDFPEVACKLRGYNWAFIKEYYSRQEKLTALRDAVLWLAEKAGLLDDKKEKAMKEIAELRTRIDKLEREIK